MSAPIGSKVNLGAVGFIIRGLISYTYDLRHLSSSELVTVINRTPRVIFAVEKDLKRIVYNYRVDATGFGLALGFIPEVWSPIARKPLSQENVSRAVTEAITKVTERDTRHFE